MMLVSLFPEYESKFGRLRGVNLVTRGSNDPIFSNHRGRDLQKVLATWFYKGEYVTESTRTLNRLMVERTDNTTTSFDCLSKTKRDSTFNMIVDSIDVGLPVMMGLSTPDYGDHTVLIRGYWEGKEKWLLINDPGVGETEVSWDSLKNQKKGKFEIGICKPNTHRGYRPMKRITRGSDERQRTTIERWTPVGYIPVEDEFK